MLIEFQKGNRHYEGLLADDAHKSVKKLDEFRGRYTQMIMGLHPKKYLQTESTQLYKGQRNKGHGIVLYIFLIEIARILGAKRIYSSRGLNRHSRRMWAEKLSQIYDVKKKAGFCRQCHRAFKHGKKPTFFIDLQEK